MVKRLLLFSVCLPMIVGLAFGQARDITGTVTDAKTGFALPGVNISIQGTTTGTASAVDGSYTIRAATGDVLVFSFIGFISEQRTVGGGSTMNVSLLVDEVLLDEVVVVGYGTQKRADITGSVGSVDASEANVGLISSPEQLLQGRVAGVSIIQNGGEPGAPVTVRIRGGTSISASNEPLYVIDGVPIDNSSSASSLISGGGNTPDSGAKNPLVFLNPNDIESIDVLKDASASAIYGSRGANGVILITTKKGRSGQTIVDYDGYVSTSDFAGSLDLLSASEYRSFVQSQGLPTVNLGNADTDWQEAVTQTAISQQHNLAMGGGTDDTQYRASVSYLNNQGVINNSGMERVSGRTNVNHTAFDGKLRLDMRITGSYFNDNRAAFNQTGGFEGGLLTNVMKFNPTLPVVNADGSFFEVLGQTSVRNPVAMASQVQDNTKTTRVLSSMRADYSLFDDFTVSANIGLDRSQSSRSYFIPAANPLKAAVGGEAQRGENELSSKVFELTGNYAKVYDGGHDVQLLGGYSFQEFVNEGFGALSQGFVSDVFSFNSLAAGQSSTFDIRSFRTKSRLVSFFGRLNYSYNSRYIFSASLRRDGSSRFGNDNKWGTFPAVTLGWRLSSESFMEDVDFVDDLKLRVGYGITGSQEIGNLRSLPIFGASGNAVIGNAEVSGVAPTNLANPDLKWEETSQINVGLDYELWNSRVSGSIEFYKKTTDDLLLEFEVPQPAAVPTRLANAGEMENTGIEFSINAFVYDKEDLTAELGTTFNANSNEVINLGGREQIFTGRVSGAGLSGINSQLITPGEPFGTFFGPTFLGFDPATGSQMFEEDAQGNRVLSIIGNAQPDFTYGFTGNVTWKQVDFSFFLRGEQGRDIFNNTGLEYTSKNLANTNVNFLREALEDPTPLAEAPVYSSRWIQDGSFLRLENLTVGYTFRNLTGASDWIGTVRRARIYLAANNLFVLTDYNGFDPEANTNAGTSAGSVPIASLGVDYTNYPRARTFTVGVSLGF